METFINENQSKKEELEGVIKNISEKQKALSGLNEDLEKVIFELNQKTEENTRLSNKNKIENMNYNDLLNKINETKTEI